ncbi:nuclear transport factor 2 family protein [Nocardia sp. BMG51109]|uniref:nuclear transport factor 2 family protein n=1 Tax=Nocardia sp. BMG51109 TaxID=1056816 RepID=UPI0004B08122|nr:nuclear transport factor 2 family protein [Nocardia sp. BMG51109]
MTGHEGTGGARAVLERFRQAVIDRSAEDMTDLFAEEAVLEFPFHRPGVPARLDGRREIVEFMAGNWTGSPLRYRAYHTLAVHDTADPGTIVASGRSPGRARPPARSVCPTWPS